ncbi:MAG: chorismate synthase [Clostridiales bacterium]|nr:chorismate synthase [Clostridiales bacterium]
MSNTIGNRLKVTVFGQSHAGAIGAVVEGLPAGMEIDWDAVRAFLRRRAPGRSPLSTARREADEFEVLSGLNADGRTCGAPVAAVIRNADARSADYDAFKNVPRPGHADFAAFAKFGGARDVRGGGQFSGRLTAPLCFAGALAIQALAERGVRIGAHIARLAGIDDDAPDPVRPVLPFYDADGFPTINLEKGERMREAILTARREGDSVGGIVRAVAAGVPAGLGEPMFDGVENRIARMMFGIPAVRGVEFGEGFRAADMLGSAHNDPFVIRNGRVETGTNRHGGALGGIATGMPILCRVAFKPTPSIAKGQRSVDLDAMEEVPLSVAGRHDPCIVPRAVPVVESVLALAILDLMLEGV